MDLISAYGDDSAAVCAESSRIRKSNRSFGASGLNSRAFREKNASKVLLRDVDSRGLYSSVAADGAQFPCRNRATVLIQLKRPLALNPLLRGGKSRFSKRTRTRSWFFRAIQPGLQSLAQACIHVKAGFFGTFLKTTKASCIPDSYHDD